MNRYSNSPKGGDFGGSDWHLVVLFDEVNLAEDSAAVQAVGQVLHVLEGVSVRCSDSVINIMGLFCL